MHNSQKVEINQMSINGWMDKQNVVYTHSETLFGNKKEWNSVTCYDIDESCQHYAKQKKLDTKDHIWFHLYEMPRIGKSVEAEIS